MNDELLQSAWQKMKAPLQTESILSNTITEMDVFKKKIKKRNAREYFACIFLIVVFLPFGFFTASTLSRIGSLIIVLSSIVIMYQLRNRKTTTADITLAPLAYLNEHLQYLKSEAKLLNTVTYWYILPPMIGVAIFLTGQDKNIWYLVFHYVILIVISVTVYYLNKEAVKTQINPVINKLEKLLEEEQTA